MANTADERAELEIAKLRAEVAKVQVEHDKLASEKAKIDSENSNLGKLARIAWPLASGLLAAALSVVTLMVSRQGVVIQREQSALREREIFVKVTEMATDTGQGDEARIAATATLAKYWNSEYRRAVAEALSAILLTGADTDTADHQPLRLAAAMAIGEAITAETPPVEKQALKDLFYGNSSKAQPGTITQRQKYLVGQKHFYEKVSGNTAETRLRLIELKLQATREAIRQNWEYLEYGLFADHDLTGIELYKARLSGAFFGGANLSGANLCNAVMRDATIANADLTVANLSGADITGLLGWQSVVSYNGANIHNVQHAPVGFLEYAKKGGAVDEPLSSWKTRVKELGLQLPPETGYFECP